MESTSETASENVSSRKRKPGVNRALQLATNRTRKESAKLERLWIERMDYERYVETLKRVRSHPKNLLRLANKRAADAKESKRNSSNVASYTAAVRRLMQRR